MTTVVDVDERVDISQGLACSPHPQAAEVLLGRYVASHRPEVLAGRLRRALLAGRVDATALLAATGEARLAVRECFAYLAGSGGTPAEVKLGTVGLDVLRESHFDDHPELRLQLALSEARATICNPTKGTRP